MGAPSPGAQAPAHVALGHAPTQPPIQPPTQRSAQPLAQRVLGRVDALTDRLVTVIGTQNPGYRSVEVVAPDDLWRSCHDNLTRVLQLVVLADRPAHDVHYDAARDTGRRRAEQGLPLDDLLRSFRLGGRLVWEAIVDEARSTPTVEDSHLLDVGTRVWEVVDRTSAEVAAAYHDAERGLVRADEQRRTSVWAALLAGAGDDAGLVFEAARLLGVPVDATYVVVVGEPGTRDSGAAQRLEDRLAADGVTSTWQAHGGGLVGLVVSSLVPGKVDTTMALLTRHLEVRAGVSPPFGGLLGVDAGFRQATLALRTLRPRDRVAALDERLPEALLLNAPELSERLVATWLGPLLALPSVEQAPLLDTLHAWVETSGSASRTAEAVHCHRNTVLNRLRRLNRLLEPTGHDLSASTPVELALALRAHRLTSR